MASVKRSCAPQIAKLREERAYREALATIATLRPAVDAFFDKVMVLDPTETVRSSHLGLIDEVLALLDDRRLQRDRDGVSQALLAFSSFSSDPLISGLR